MKLTRLFSRTGQFWQARIASIVTFGTGNIVTSVFKYIELNRGQSGLC